MQRSEGVVGNLRPRIGDRSDQGALACIRHAEQADVGQHAKFELELLRLARPARRFLARRTIGAGLEMQVAETAVTTFADEPSLARHEQFCHDLLGLDISQDRADRHAQDDIRAGSAELIGTAPRLAMARLVAPRIAVVDQCVEIQVADGIDAAAPAAVTSIRPAERNELFTPKTRTAGTAVACGNVDHGFIDKLHVAPMVEAKKPRRAGASLAKAEPPQAGSMLTVWRFKAPLTANCTCPSTRANRVWSLPIPTLVPA